MKTPETLRVGKSNGFYIEIQIHSTRFLPLLHREYGTLERAPRSGPSYPYGSVHFALTEVPVVSHDHFQQKIGFSSRSWRATPGRPMGLKTVLRKRLMRGRFRARTAKVLYDLAIALELAVEQGLDSIYAVRRTPNQLAVEDCVTAIVKTFERPAVLHRLIRSIDRKYPRLHVIVVDDSRDPKILPGVHTIVIPYDSGVSAGRSEALEHVTTEYVLVLDDDFVFFRYTNLETSLEIMQNNPGIDIIGGEVIDLPFFETADYGLDGLFPTDAEATMPAGSSIGGLPVYDKVANFFIARTDRIRLVGWDPRLKRVDHADFFTRAKGILTTVLNKDMKCLHARTPFDLAYMEKREDIDEDVFTLERKYSCGEDRVLVEDHLPRSEQ